MENNTTLVILAAGKNSRANYQNKALFTYRGVSCLENTISIAKTLFEHIIVVGTKSCEKEYNMVCSQYAPQVQVVSIVSGYGTLDALLKVCPYIVTERILMCWGDLWFKDDYAFTQTLHAKVDSPCVVPISYIPEPYSWYIMDDNFNIKTTIWRRNNPHPVKEGYFDQSCYLMNKQIIVNQLTDYNEQCVKKNIESKLDVGYEVLYQNGNPAKGIPIEYGHVFHFNTKEEFVKLEQFIHND